MVLQFPVTQQIIWNSMGARKEKWFYNVTSTIPMQKTKIDFERIGYWLTKCEVLA